MRVLVVNTLPLIQEALRIVIQRIVPNSEVLAVREPSIALSLIQSQASIDWVVIDLDTFCGPSLLAVKSIRASDSAIRVVTMSVKDDPEMVEMSLRAGASGHISKSAPIDSAIDAIQKMLVGAPVQQLATAYRAHEANGHDVSMLDHGRDHNVHSFIGHAMHRRDFDELDIAVDAESARNLAPSLAAIGDFNLTHRQRDVLALLLSGKRNKVIGEELDIESSTVKAHVSGILRALNVQNRTEAVLLAKRMGFGGPTTK